MLLGEHRTARCQSEGQALDWRGLPDLLEACLITSVHHGSPIRFIVIQRRARVLNLVNMFLHRRRLLIDGIQINLTDDFIL